MPRNEITIEVRTGETLKAVLRGLRCATKVLDLVPDWHGEERDRLRRRIRRATRSVVRDLEGRPTQ